MRFKRVPTVHKCKLYICILFCPLKMGIHGGWQFQCWTESWAKLASWWPFSQGNSHLSLRHQHLFESRKVRLCSKRKERNKQKPQVFPSGLIIKLQKRSGRTGLKCEMRPTASYLRVLYMLNWAERQKRICYLPLLCHSHFCRNRQVKGNVVF